LSRGVFDHGFEYLIDSLEKSVEINSATYTVRCVGLFERFKVFSSRETRPEYKNLIEEIYRKNDE
jgi:hypothetical protein